jgi:hypothetical protein
MIIKKQKEKSDSENEDVAVDQSNLKFNLGGKQLPQPVSVPMEDSS